jgi:hypothetical protein
VAAVKYCTQGQVTGEEPDFTVPSGWDSDEIDAAIEEASARIDALTKDHWSTKTLTFQISGDGDNVLSLLSVTNLRIVSITSVYFRSTYVATDDFVANGEEIPDTDYLISKSRRSLKKIQPTTVRSGGVKNNPIWLVGDENHRIVGTFGHSSVPTAIARATAMLVREKMDPGITAKYVIPSSETFPDGYKYSTPATAARGRAAPYYSGITAVDELIHPYVNKRPRMGVAR